MSGADLAGMTPEQALAFMKGDTEREALRNKSVVDIFEANRSIAGTDYLQSLAREARASAYAKEHPEIAFSYEAALKMIEKAKTKEELDKIRAETELAYSGGRINDAQASRIYTLVDAEKENISNQARYHGELANSFMDFEVDGKLQRGAVKDVLDYLTARSGSGGGDAEKAALQLRHKLAEYIEKIELYPNNPAMQGYAEIVNEYSPDPAVYIWAPTGSFSSTPNMRRVEIPPLDGRILSARQLTVQKRLLEKTLNRPISWPQFWKMTFGALPEGHVVVQKNTTGANASPGYGPELNQ